MYLLLQPDMYASELRGICVSVLIFRAFKTKKNVKEPDRSLKKMIELQI